MSGSSCSATSTPDRSAPLLSWAETPHPDAKPVGLCPAAHGSSEKGSRLPKAASNAPPETEVLPLKLPGALMLSPAEELSRRTPRGTPSDDDAASRCLREEEAEAEKTGETAPEAATCTAGSSGKGAACAENQAGKARVMLGG